MAHQSDQRFLVLHALRVKGFAKLDVVSELTGLPEPTVDEHLRALQHEELTQFREARELWQLTPSGRVAHGEALADDVADDGIRAALREPYEGFLTLNETFKALCGEWQLKDGSPNDHSDSAYDGAVIARLVEIDGKAQPACSSFAAVMDRYGTYAPRLQTAADKVQGGNHQLFTGVMCNSYHDVWMELHEDLILTLGIDRAKEGSF